jgi:hypothetical protein
MWEPRRLTTLWASMACYRDSFAFYLYWLSRSTCYFSFYTTLAKVAYVSRIITSPTCLHSSFVCLPKISGVMSYSLMLSIWRYVSCRNIEIRKTCQGSCLFRVRTPSLYARTHRRVCSLSLSRACTPRVWCQMRLSNRACVTVPLLHMNINTGWHQNESLWGQCSPSSSHKIFRRCYVHWPWIQQRLWYATVDESESSINRKLTNCEYDN